MVKHEMLGLAGKYGLSDAREGLSTISDAVLSCFVQGAQLYSAILCYRLGSFHCSYVFYVFHIVCVSVCCILCVFNKL